MKRKEMGWLLALLVWIGGCTTTEEAANHLIGNWQITWVQKDGEVISGPGFHGTKFEFRQNGTVRTEDHKGDTSLVQYQQSADSLVYIFEGGKEIYSLDTLSHNYLQMTVLSGPNQTTLRMRKLKK